MNDRIFNSAIILIVLCSTLLTSNAFADPIIYSKWIGALLLVFTYTIYAIAVLNNKYVINKLYISIFAFIIYLALHSILFFLSYEHIFLFYLSGFFILYSLFYFYKEKINTIFFHDTLCLIGIIQSIIGVIQILRKIPIIGTYDNPTGFAISLVCIFPFIYYRYRTIRSNKRKWFYKISICLITIAIILSGCRACIIALVVILGFMICSKKYIVLIAGISVTLVLTICYKGESSIGRAFIYQTSTNMIDSQTLLLGKGHGGFKREYMTFQANWFEHNTNSRNAILADNISHPLNEYLLLLIEYGIIGCIFILIASIIFFKYADQNSPSFLCVLAISIIACFSYPFRYPLTLVLLAYSLASIGCKSVYTLKVTKMFKTVIICSLILGILYLSFDIKHNYSWKKQIALCSLGKVEKALPAYDTLYSNMKDNPYFLYNYSAILHQLGKYQKSNDILTCCNLYLNDYDTDILRADNYYALKQYKEAEYYYIHASCMCPNRFQPVYQLMCLYKDCKDIKQAQYMANKIINKEIKVPSIQVNRMIQEANSFLADTTKYY